MWEELIGRNVVLDLRSTYVCMGKLHSVHADFLEVRNADLHDLRDTQTTREYYVAASRLTGINPNRESVFILRSEIVAVSPMEDVVEG
jgi:hypothetical protein